MQENLPQKKVWRSDSGGWVVLFFIFLFLFAKWGPAIPFSVLSQSKGEPLVVSGQGKVYVTPDIAKVNFGIEESGQSLKIVQSSVNQKSKKLTDSLKNMGISSDDIQTTSYNVFPQYDYTNPASRITGFSVSVSYEVTIRDFDKVNDILTAGVGAGANIVGGVAFEINEKTKKEKLNEARKMAVNEAKEKAQGLAGAAGITLGKVINISENEGGVPIPFLSRDMMATGSKGEPAVPANIEPGKTEININVTLSYEVR